ncbi:DUF6163 family protein [Afifella sp. IM 167]|uniref:DUF6163 family protein n=1 Tax=Afifella sp. IM 167 TaxID=2033586 RepID=UPI001CCBAF6C|nr:DUF6163 family protein [Afifella sp. IM 167]MBZ8132603.1 hypothetical protein [Afifella sp. IM 167]
MSDAVEFVSESASVGRGTRYYLRFVALILLAAGLMRAGELMGVSFQGGHFLALEPAWRVALVVLCILNLLAGVGLWIGAVWGPVIWAVAAIAEISMYTLFSDIYGAHQNRVIVHLAFFGLYLVFLFSDWRRRRREE